MEKLTGKSKQITIGNALQAKTPEEIAAGRKRIHELFESRAEGDAPHAIDPQVIDAHFIDTHDTDNPRVTAPRVTAPRVTEPRPRSDVLTMRRRPQALDAVVGGSLEARSGSRVVCAIQ